MKAAFSTTDVLNGAKRISAGLAFAAAMLLHRDASAIPPVNLGTASDFSVLAGAGIVVAGPPNSTSVTGDIGTFPTTTIDVGNILLNGVNHAGDAVTQNAKNDLFTAYGDAAGRTATVTYGAIFDLGGMTLGSGVYRDPSSFAITGTLTLDAGGDPAAVWIFQMGSTLNTASGSKVALIGGAQAGNVFWQVGTSATLGSDTDFAGSLLAVDSITLNAGVTVAGRLLAQNATITLDNNSIIVPEPGMLLPGAALTALIAFRQRFFPTDRDR
jgi:hypothetical protein